MPRFQVKRRIERSAGRHRRLNKAGDAPARRAPESRAGPGNARPPRHDRSPFKGGGTMPKVTSLPLPAAARRASTARKRQRRDTLVGASTSNRVGAKAGHRAANAIAGARVLRGAIGLQQECGPGSTPIPHLPATMSGDLVAESATGPRMASPSSPAGSRKQVSPGHPARGHTAGIGAREAPEAGTVPPTRETGNQGGSWAQWSNTHPRRGCNESKKKPKSLCLMSSTLAADSTNPRRTFEPAGNDRQPQNGTKRTRRSWGRLRTLQEFAGTLGEPGLGSGAPWASGDQFHPKSAAVIRSTTSDTVPRREPTASPGGEQ